MAAAAPMNCTHPEECRKVYIPNAFFPITTVTHFSAISADKHQVIRISRLSMDRWGRKCSMTYDFCPITPSCWDGNLRGKTGPCGFRLLLPK